MSLDYKQNVILLVKDNQNRPFIIDLDKKCEYKYFNLNVDIDVESVLCMQRIGEKWLLIFHYEDDNAVIYNADGSEYVKFYIGEGFKIVRLM